MKEKINIRFVVLLFIIILMGVWRVLATTIGIPEWANFSPVGAMALFGGSYFMSRYKSYAFPLLVLLISDLILMHTIYAPYRKGLLYENWYWVYGSFALMVLIGEVLIKKVSVSSFLLGSLVAAMAHFIISNFGVWLHGGLNLATGMPYTKDWIGLMSCYVAAIAGQSYFWVHYFWKF